MPEYTYHIPPPCDAPVDVIHADEDILVVSKPTGLLSVPGRFVKDCALQRLSFDYPDIRVVHRLDLDTSGLMVFALGQLAVSDLNKQFRERRVSKRYTALVFGNMNVSQGDIDLPIAPDPDRRPRQKIDPKGKAALTQFEVSGFEQGNTRVQLTPVTGRSHQLRIHLAEIGHPILGCDLYAHKAAFESTDRLCLHAASLTLAHPRSGDRMSFTSPVPF